MRGATLSRTAVRATTTWFVCIVLSGSLFTLGMPRQAAAQPLGRPVNLQQPHATDRVLVKMRPQASSRQRDRLERKRGNLRASVVRKLSLLPLQVWRLPADVSVDAAIRKLQSDPAVEYVEPDYVVSIPEPAVASSTRSPLASSLVYPADPYFGLQWGLLNTGQAGGLPGADIRAPEAWAQAAGLAEGPPVVVAVIDTGVDYGHPDLAGNMWTNPGEIPGNHIDDDKNGYVDDVYGWDFVNDDADPSDDFGHGTHVAGVIAAVSDNGIGIAGIASGARVMALKFLDVNGSGYTSDAVLAVEYATRMGARLSSNSWGGGGFSQALYDAISEAAVAGRLFIAAAGNSAADSDAGVVYPQGYELPNVVSVAASDSSDALASFSNYGQLSVDLAAPGVSILSTMLPGAHLSASCNDDDGDGYAYCNGTSMATPFVSGVAALLWTYLPGADREEIRQRLLRSVDGVGALATRVRSGGRLNAASALDYTGLTAAPDALSFLVYRDADGIDAPAAAQSIDLGKLGGGGAAFSVQGSQSWLSASPSSGTATAGGLATVDVAADASGLPWGTSSDRLTVTSSDPPGSSFQIPVTLTVRLKSLDMPGARLDPAGGSVDQGFGRALSLDGDVLVAGAPDEQVAGTGLAGAVYVFRVVDGAFVQEARIVAPDLAFGENFGQAVAVSGDVLAVGAPGDSAAGDSNGAVYIYRRVAGAWKKEAKLIHSDPQQWDMLGRSLALRGNTLVAGAPVFVTGPPHHGAAYVFKYDGSNWTQTQKLADPGFNVDSQFAFSIALDPTGTTAVVGAPADNPGGSYKTGSAYVYRSNGASFVLAQKLDAADGHGYDNFGLSVAAEGTSVAVGAYWVYGVETKAIYQGAAYTFRWDGTKYFQESELMPPDGRTKESFGVSVALSGDGLIVGAYGDADSGPYAGAAYLYRWDGSDWRLRGKQLAADGASYDFFGTSVAADDGYFAVAATYRETSGRVYVYAREGQPDAVTGLSATPAGATQIALAWNPVAAETLDHYDVFRSGAAAGPYSYVGAAQSAAFANGGLTPSTTYYYVVTAVTPDGTSSPQSDPASATTGDLLEVSFTYSPGLPATTTPVSFLDTTQSSRPIILREWCFDYDGVNFTVDSNAASPSHTYSAAGSYTAALRVTTSAGVKQTVTRSFVVQAPPKPSQGQILSLSADYSTDDRTFRATDTMYIKVWSGLVNYQQMKDAKYKISVKGINVQGNLSNLYDGSFVAAVPLKKLTKPGDGTVELTLQDKKHVSYKPKLTISIVK